MLTLCLLKTTRSGGKSQDSVKVEISTRDALYKRWQLAHSITWLLCVFCRPKTDFWQPQQKIESDVIVRDGYRAAATSKMERFVIIVNGF